MSRVIERLLWILAAVAFATFALAAGESWLYQSYYKRELAHTLSAPARVRTAVAPTGVPPGEPKRETKVVEGQPLGLLTIPSINLSTVFLEGVETRTLRHGVGHVPGTALPGVAAGNVALSAHRDTFFRRLREIRKNDGISLTTSDGSYQYKVESTKVVDPDEAIVLRNIGRPTLTLITCFPFYYVGPAPKRFVVHAALVTDTP